MPDFEHKGASVRIVRWNMHHQSESPEKGLVQDLQESFDHGGQFLASRTPGDPIVVSV